MEKKLPEKVEAMYRAVKELISEGTDINRIKVSDITQRAGIGKGTAYEYFSNKEELISSALLYQMNGIYNELQEKIAEQKNFKECIHFIFAVMEEQIGQRDCFLKYVHILTDNGVISEKLRQELKKQGEDTYASKDCIGEMICLGRRTGEINTTLPETYIYLTIASKIIGYAVYLTGEFKNKECSSEELQELICTGLLHEFSNK